MPAPRLYWLEKPADWRTTIQAAEADKTFGWTSLVRLAGHDFDFLQTERVDRLFQRRCPDPPVGLSTRPIRLAVLGSSTTGHLLPAIRVASLRRGLWLAVQEGDYGQYLQALLGPDPGLQACAPDAILLTLDAHHLAAELDGSAAAETRLMAKLRRCWTAARERFGATVFQQTAMPVLPPLMGANEHRLSSSPARALVRLNGALRDAADEAGVHLLAMDDRLMQDGLDAWHDPVLWHRSKQEVSPAAAPMYGELVARLLAAAQGRSAKALVLDLDNTLWGGVIGDDGPDGIVLGQGSALGEAYVALQHYAKQLSTRGIILAVCSKNDEAVALSAFDTHPEMVLRRSDIASFVANWDDKAANLRRIARELNIGLDALVFVDDNPFERNLVREHLPEVMVPDIPDDDPSAVPRTLADAGYFESLSVTDDDRQRVGQYKQNQERRAALEDQATDLPGYLRGLDMRLTWKNFDAAGLSRVVQLINKTNQFNLTTRRISEAEAQAVMADPHSFGLQLRLTDRFGDNGIIAVVIGRMTQSGDCHLDTWLMSCRVLGRQVEQATLRIVAEEARRHGARTLMGLYVATAKNEMVREHYTRLGFDPISDKPGEFRLDLSDWKEPETVIAIAGA